MTPKRLILLLSILIALVVPLLYAQEPSPSPAPVDQQWRVYYGDIDTLEVKLHELNKQQTMVYEGNIRISDDGKRFVILLSADQEEEHDH